MAATTEPKTAADIVDALEVLIEDHYTLDRDIEEALSALRDAVVRESEIFRVNLSFSAEATGLDGEVVVAVLGDVDMLTAISALVHAGSDAVVNPMLDALMTEAGDDGE